MLAAASVRVTWAVDYPGKAPGPAVIKVEGDRFAFSNQVLSGSWGLSSTGLHGTSVRDPQSGWSWETSRELFRIVLADDTTYASSALKVVDPSFPSNSSRRKPSGPKLADHFAGRGLEVTLMSEDERLHVVWRAVLLDESNYIRQELELSAPKEPLTIREVVWLDETIPNAASAGSVDGSAGRCRATVPGLRRPDG